MPFIPHIRDLESANKIGFTKNIGEIVGDGRTIMIALGFAR